MLIESIRGVRADLVDIDNAQASADAVRHLIELGHTEIVHFSGPAYSEHTRERVSGVRRAFGETHLVFDEAMVVGAGDSTDDGYRAGLAHFQEKRRQARPTAVTCYNDLVALGVVRALNELRLRVPEDVSVIGFDDLQILGHLPLALTTVNVPQYTMGKQAAEMLIRRIEGSEEDPVERVIFDAPLVVRKSTQPPQVGACAPSQRAS